MADVLQAAARVLAEEGAQRFTTARVAERAGVSVGSIYQYFPNKASILFGLQAEEWRTTTELLGTILRDGTKPPLQRLRAAVHAFIHSECEEAQLRVALNDAAPLYRDAPEVIETKATGDGIIRRFMEEMLPDGSDRQRDLARDLVFTTLSSVGKQFSESYEASSDIDLYADALSDMFSAYLLTLGARR